MNGFTVPGEYFSKKIVFETERLKLRRIEASDSADMFSYSSLEATSRYLLWSPHTSEYATRCMIDRLKREYRDGLYYELAIVLRENGRMIGTCGITSYSEEDRTVEIGYVISPQYWGMGIAPEASSVIINFAFCQLGAHRVEARYIKENERSRRVMEKCGMRFEGIARNGMLVKGRSRDIGICAMTRDDYFSVPREDLYKKFNPIGHFGFKFRRT